ncbi:MAG: type II toxin-antitoxin system VapB family antitoxin [Candidatus Methylumidiphilus sp.]
MTIQVTLDEQLLQEAMKYAPVITEGELVDLALREYILKTLLAFAKSNNR